MDISVTRIDPADTDRDALIAFMTPSEFRRRGFGVPVPWADLVP